ncbi:MAG TPA: hemerythrin domain-containing protein [Acidimicrobiales bacterium]|nr:hemerythrin domain-containing protein [Acidimicrobiales bacterium]
MNALTFLHQEHQNVDALFKRFEDAGPKATKTKSEIVQKVIEHLSVHAAIEEQVFYPAVEQAVPSAKGMVLEALEEHHGAKMFLMELEKLPPTFERYDAKVTVLIEQVRHHVEEEENELFPQVREAMTVQELEELGERLQEARKAAPTRPHPFQPDRPPLNLVLGAPVAVWDRAVNTGKELVGRLLNR